MKSTSPRVVVVGGGAAAWMTAAALARAFRHRGIDVTVADSGIPADAPAGEWTLPSTPGMHRLLGLGEGALMRTTGATFRLGSAHLGWQGEGSQFVHAHGEIGQELHGIPFYKLIVGRRIAGDQSMAPDAFSLAAMAIHLGKFARPMSEGDALKSSFTYGLHLSTVPYVAQLREQARAAGVKIATGALADVEFDAGRSITAVTLSGGDTLAGDLFLDCSGREGALISRLPDDERDDWSHWLPCDRMISGVSGPIPENRAATETEAMTAGWWWRMPLANASVVGAVYQSGLLGDELAREQLRQASGIRDFSVTRFKAGRRRHFWVRNCVALGDAAMELEPLVGASLHFVQLGIGVLMELFPLAAARQVEADEYNRVMGAHADGLRDFTLAHYLCSTRPGELWEAIRATPAPDRLAMRLALFKASGRILVFDQETFEEVDWAWLLLGSGYQPDSLEAQTALRVARITQTEAVSLAGQVNALAQSMPPHTLFLQHVSQSHAG